MEHFTAKNRFAYVFYATDDNYATAVCVAVKHLKQTNIRGDIDIAVLHLPIAKYILNTMRKMNIITVKVDALPYYCDKESSFGNRLKFSCHSYIRQEQTLTWLKSLKKRILEISNQRI